MKIWFVMVKFNLTNHYKSQTCLLASVWFYDTPCLSFRAYNLILLISVPISTRRQREKCPFKVGEIQNWETLGASAGWRCKTSTLHNEISVLTAGYFSQMHITPCKSCSLQWDCWIKRTSLTPFTRFGTANLQCKNTDQTRLFAASHHRYRQTGG